MLKRPTDSAEKVCDCIFLNKFAYSPQNSNLSKCLAKK